MNMSDVKAITVPDYRYRELEYIESSGTQYIDTGVIATNNLKVGITFRQISDTGAMGVIRQVGSNYVRHHITQTSSGINFSLGGTYNIKNYPDLLDDNTTHIWWINNTTGISQMDSVSSSFTSQAAFTCQGTYYLFARNNVNMTTPITYINIRLYKVQLYKGTNTIINKFIPVQRKSDNMIGMYDTVQHKFHPNLGTGDFIMGPIVNEYINVSVDKIQDSNNTVLWQRTTKYRKLKSLGWWCNSTTAADQYKGLSVPLDFSYPEYTKQDFEFCGQWYKNQIRHSPIFSNYINNNGVILNVNQDNSNCPYFVNAKGNWNTGTSNPLSNTIWNSSISPEVCSRIWSNQAQGTSNKFIKSRTGSKDGDYNPDSDFKTLLTQNESTKNLSWNIENTSPNNTGVFCVDTTTTNTKHWRGKFYRLTFGTIDSSGKWLYDHYLVPAQRKSDSRVGLYDEITNTFYPDVNNYLNNNYNLKIGATIDENPIGWL